MGAILRYLYLRTAKMQHKSAKKQQFYFVFPVLFHGYSSAMDIHAALMSSRAFIIPSHNNEKFSSSELLPGDSFPLFFKY